MPTDTTLLEDADGHDPLALFQRWLADAEQTSLNEPSAMILSTADNHGFPSARVVLLRGLDERGFAFYTNYDSRKGAELAVNPRASLTFFWDPLRRQVRIEGTVSKVNAEQSDDYFSHRPRGHQLSAHVSRQSEVVQDRATLEKGLAEITAQFEGKEVTRPQHWGGYCLQPSCIEFWQNREGRLHDRLRYRLQSDGTWKRERLAP